MKLLYATLLSVLVFNFGFNAGIGEAKNMIVEKGKEVSIDYTLTVEGEVIDSSQGKSPLQYTQGEGQIIVGLEKELEGLKVGDEKTVVVPPEEAYGLSDPEAFQEVPRSSLPSEIKPQVGMYVQAKGADGKVFPVKITEVKENMVVINFNHPLAGKTLKFDIKIVSIK